MAIEFIEAIKSLGLIDTQNHRINNRWKDYIDTVPTLIQSVKAKGFSPNLYSRCHCLNYSASFSKFDGFSPSACPVLSETQSSFSKSSRLFLYPLGMRLVLSALQNLHKLKIVCLEY